MIVGRLAVGRETVFERVPHNDPHFSYWREVPPIKWARQTMQDKQSYWPVLLASGTGFLMFNFIVSGYLAANHNHSWGWVVLTLATMGLNIASKVCMLQASHFQMARLVSLKTQGWVADKIMKQDGEMLDWDGREVIKLRGEPQ